ncbi:MAG: outer membrane lipoprotein carrier protein LolA [Marinilabilia sp.]
MKDIFFVPIILMFFAVTAITAQSPEVQKAERILEEVSGTTQSYESIKADFTFTLEDTQSETTDRHEGDIILSGEKYKASLMNVDSYFDGETLWTHLKEVGEVNISYPDKNDDTTLNPANIFNIYKEGFRYMFAGEDTIDGRKVDVVDLFPEDRDRSFSRIKLYINQDSRHISKISQLGKDGNNYIIDIENMETDVPCDSSMFIFDEDEHPDVDVIDMR